LPGTKVALGETVAIESCMRGDADASSLSSSLDFLAGRLCLTLRSVSSTIFQLANFPYCRSPAEATRPTQNRRARSTGPQNASVHTT
jgi:hypothetical protein